LLSSWDYKLANKEIWWSHGGRRKEDAMVLVVRTVGSHEIQESSLVAFHCEDSESKLPGIPFSSNLYAPP
jgi:hypothetical protein